MTIIERTIGVSESITINSEPSKIWKIFANVNRWKSWTLAITGTNSQDQPWAKNAEFKLTIKPWWRTIVFHPSIIEIQPPQKLVWLGKAAGLYGQQTFTLEETPSGTLTTSYNIFSGEMLWAMPLFAPEGKLRHMYRQWLDGLKWEVEHGSPSPDA